ncbi:DUF4185 domain-containing protein [Micromonospora avicenniae]|uniref:DUF4185 domain-containing protein n=1 Tax=Micromonospora avicenniae TaxID=1198245 RepID=A0A1N6VUD4_9ACTN|nr:DUF4185 domain-containing protein [Micromonospora avicenniae]SIQ81276.1 hypothetical protein SAMN05444858_104247 [Micromonospora avicenniae]
MRRRRVYGGLVALLVGSTTVAIGPAAGASASGAPGDACAPVVTAARPAVGLQQKWAHFGDGAGAGEWAGGDGTYSAPLPDGRTAWLFNDTFLGPVGPGRSITPHAPVHNTIVTAHGRSDRPTETLLRGTPENPLPIVGPAGTDDPWYWNGDGIVDDGKLYVFEFQQQAAGEGHFGFEWIGTDLASLSLPDLRLQQVAPTYDAHGIQWGVELLRVGEYIYIYGVGSQWPGKQAHVARALAGHLDEAWEFYTGSGWSPNEGDSVSILDEVGSSYGVAEVQGRYVFVTTDSYLGSKIYVHTASTPFGFAGTERVQVYDTPEGQPEFDADADGDIYTYNVAVHPTLGDGNNLVVSYNVNSTSIADLYGDISNNRARYLDLRFASAHRPCG